MATATTATTSKKKGLALALGGATVATMQPAVSQKGNVYYTVHGKTQTPGVAARFGVLFAPEALEAFPQDAQVGDLDIPLNPGTTTNGSPKVSGSGKLDIDGETYQVRVQVSRTDTGWNLIAKAFPGGTANVARAAGFGDLA